MAKRMTVAELLVSIKAEMANFRSGFKQSTADINSFVNEVGVSSKSMQSMALGLMAVGGGIIATGMKAVSIFADLEQSMANTASVTGGTTEELKELEYFARKMGKTTIFTANQAGDAMYYLASAGYNTEKIFSSLQGILALAASTQYDLSETTAAVVTVLNAFRLSADQASRVANVYAAAISSSQATMFKLQESMKFIAPTAAMVNYTLEQSVAALSFLYDAGLEASMSGTQLRMALTRLMKPTKIAKQSMLDLGTSYKKLDPATHDLVDIVLELESVNAGAAKSGKYMAEIFGVRSLNAMSILTKKGGMALALFQDSITGTTKALDMQQRQIDTLKGTWRLMTSVIRESAIIIGSVYQPILKATMESVRQLNLWFGALPASIQTTGVAVITTAGSYMLFIGTVIMLSAQLIKANRILKETKLAFLAFGGKLTVIFAAIAAVAAATIYLISAQERQKRQYKELLLNYSSMLNEREKELSSTIMAEKTLRKLINADEKNETLMLHRAAAIEKMNTLYPGLIENEVNLESQLDKVGKVAKESEKELERLRKTKAVLRDLKMAEDIREAGKEVGKLRKELSGIGTGEKITKFLNLDVIGVMSARNFGIMRKELDLVGAKFSEITSDSKRVLKDIYTSAKSVTLSGAMIEKRMKEMVSSEEGRVELLAMQQSLLSVIVDQEGELRIIKDGIYKKSSNIGAKEMDRKKILENIVPVERKILETIVKVTRTKMALQRATQRLEQSEKDYAKVVKDGFEEEDELSRQARADEQKWDKLLYDLEVAGVENRRVLREKEFVQWKSDMINRIMDMGISRVRAEEMIQTAVGRKRVQINLENSNDIADYERMIALKSTNDVLVIRLKNLETQKVQALKTAREAGKGSAEVEKAFDIQILDAHREVALMKMKAETDLSNQTAETRVQAMGESIEKELAMENVKYKKEIDGLAIEQKEALEKVKEGLLARESVENQFRERHSNLEREHSNNTKKIETDIANERRKISDELYIDLLNAKLVFATKGKDIVELGLMQENIAYEERKSNLQNELDEQLELVRQGKTDQEKVEKLFIAKSLALVAEHEAKKNTIKLNAEEIRKEMDLELYEDSALSYENELIKYKDFLEEKLVLLSANMEGYQALLEKIQSIEERINNERKKKAKSTQKFVADTFLLIGEAWGKAAQGGKDAWKEALKSYVSMVAEALRAEAMAKLAISWVNPIAAAGWLAAIGLISAAEQAAYGRIDAAAYGGRVIKTGAALVHEDETIIPASLSRSSPAVLNRMTWDEMGGISGIRNKKTQIDFNINVSAEGFVLTPANLDEQDIFYEKIIKPAEERLLNAVKSVQREV